MSHETEIKFALGTDNFPEQFARPFRSLAEERRLGLWLLAPRFGYSPRVSSVKVIDACNFDCLYCNANKVQGRQMTTEEIRNVSKNLAGAKIQMEDLTGGEPTLRQDLQDIVADSHSLGMVVTVNTNGGNPKSTMFEEYTYWYKLAEAGLFGAHFSYDGIGQKQDPRVIHLAAFLVNTLHIYGGVRTVVTQENLDQVFDIGRVCMLNNIFFQAVPAVALGGETSASSGQFKPLDYYGRQEFIAIMTRLSKVRGPFANFLRVPTAYLQEVVAAPNPATAWHCQNPSAHWISVDARGNARVCNDRVLSKTYSLVGEDNPLLTKEFHQDINQVARQCQGCSWFCHWEGNKRQSLRGMAGIKFYGTVNSLT